MTFRNGMPIAVLGSANIDFVVRQERLPKLGETIRGSAFAIEAGGKGLNQAIGAARAGASVSFLGRVGRDEFGIRLESALRSEKINVERLIVDDDLATGVAQVSVFDNGDNAIVVVAGANGSVNWSAEDSRIVAGSAALVTQLERPLSLVRTALKVARAHGVITALTPAPVTPGAVELLDLTDILFLNSGEASAMSGDSDPIRAALALSGRAGLVVLTRGGAPTLVAREGRIVIVQPARAVEVIDTTGAGDCFAGTFMASYVREEPLEACLRTATAAASLSVSQPGASISMPDRQEVEKLLSDEHRLEWATSQGIRLSRICVAPPDGGLGQPT